MKGLRCIILSSGEGPLFAEYSIEMDKKIRELGPSPIKEAILNSIKAA